MHHIEHGMTPRDATVQAMKEVSGPGHRHRPDPVGGVHPGGLRGRPDRPDVPAVRADHRDLGPALGVQRAVALAGARGDVPQARAGRAGARSGCSSEGFNWVFDKTTVGYVSVARLLVRKAVLTILIVARWPWAPASSAAPSRPASSPTRTRALLGVNVQLPPGASLERTGGRAHEVEEIVAKTPGVESFTTIGGFGVRDEHLPAQLRHHLRPAQAVGGTPGRPSCT